MGQYNFQSVGGAASDAFAAAVLRRRIQQAEDIKQAMDVQTAQSNLETAKQNREINEMFKTQQVENLKADKAKKDAELLQLQQTAVIKTAPLDGMPWAPKLEQDFIKVGLDPNQFRSKGKEARALSFGAPTALPPQELTAAPVGLSMGAPMGLGQEVTPPEVIPAQEATPDLSTVAADDLRRLSPEAQEKAIAYRQSAGDKSEAAELMARAKVEAAEIAQQYGQEGRDQMENLRRDLTGASLTQGANFERARQDEKDEAKELKAFEKDEARARVLQGGRRLAQDALNVIDLIAPGGELSPGVKSIVGKKGYDPMQFVRDIPGYDARVLVKQTLSKQIVSLMSEMKAQSPTGATGFGQLSVKELELLSAAAGRLDLGQSPDQFLKAVNDIKVKLARVFELEDWEVKRSAKSSVAVGAAPTETPEQRYKRLTGEK